MNPYIVQSNYATRVKRYTLVLLVIWTAVVIAMATWALYSSRQTTLEAARIEAQSTFNKDLLYRRWAAMHGGIYVPVSDETPPNPYLSVPHRDVTLSTGEQMTLINPAYMTRQVHEIAQEQDGIRGHMTSLDPIRPENAPDAWETDALLAFEDGAREVSEVVMMDGEDTMRYMQAMMMEADCMVCHEEQGYEVGSVRGGISVAVPMQPYWEAHWPIQSGILFGHGLLWLLGLSGIVISRKWLIDGFRREASTAHILREAEQRYAALFEGSMNAVYLHDFEGNFVDANDAALTLLGYTRKDIPSLNFAHLVIPQELAAVAQRLEEIKETGTHRLPMTYTLRRRDGEIVYVETMSSVIHRGDQPPIIQGIARDITERKQIETHLRLLNHAATELLMMHDQDSIYTYMGHQLAHLLAGEAMVVVNRFDPADAAFIIQGVYGIDETQLGKVFKAMGYSPVGQVYQSDPRVTPLFEKGHLLKFDGGLAVLAERVVPKAITRQLIRLLNLGDVYLIGLCKEDNFYAGVQFYMYGDNTVRHPDLIEVFVQQVAIALQRVQAEEALRESEELFRAFVEQSNDAIMLVGPEGEIMEWNRARERLTGIPYDQVVGQPIWDVQTRSASEDDPQKIKQQLAYQKQTIRQALNGDQPPWLGQPTETCLRHQDGTLRSIQMMIFPIETRHGRLLGSITRDITDRKHMEIALRESEERLRALLSAIPDLMFRNHRDGTYLDFHTPDASMLIAPPDEFLGRKTQDLLPPDLAAQHLHCIEQALQTGEQQYYEYEVPIEDAVRTFEARMVVCGQDEVLTIIRDITDRRQMETALAKSEAHLQSILDSQTTFVLRTDLKGRYTYVNDAMHQRFRWMFPTKADMIGTNSMLTICEEHHPRTFETVCQCMDQPDTAVQVELRKPAEDGTPFWGYWEFVALTDARGEVTEIQCTGIDVTERKQAQQREFELKMEKERRHLLTTFIRNAMHEFRTPLATINSSVYLMSRSDDGAYRESKVEQVGLQVERITKLIDMLMMMARLESNGPLSTVPVQINDVLQSMRDIMLRRSCEKQHGIQWWTAPDLPPVMGNVEYLVHVLDQLLDNAHRFAPEGGTINVQTGTDGETVWIDVCDSGPGIPEEVLPRIFETFWRQDESHTTPGLGLGLPIAQKIIEHHGGRIHVESIEGQGSVFRVELPAAEKSTASALVRELE
jgi:PAS domain S-box-containing protein